MTFRLFIVLVLCPIGLLWSGEKKLDLETAVSHYRTLQPATLKQVQWLKAGDLFSCVVEGEPRHFLKIYNTDLAEVAELALDDLNSALALKEKDRLPAFPQLFWHTKQTFYFWNRDTLRLFDLPSGKMEKSFSLPEGAQDPKLAPNLKWVAFRKDNNLWISRKPGEYEPVTREESPEIISGSYVHRREFGISEGIFPSPEGKYLAFYQKDEREVEDYPYVDLTTLPAAAAPAKYPMAGSTNHKVRIGIVRPGKAEITWLKGVEGNTHYFANPTWSPDEKYLWVTRINRDQTTLEMLRFQASSGELEGKVFEESAERYLDPQTGPFFIGKNDDRALWLSQKDGYNHLYLVQTKDKAVSQLTRGEWEISDFLGSSESGEEVYFSAARESPITRDLYRFSPGDGAISRLSEGTGTHRCIISLQNGYFVDLFSSITVPNRVTLMKGDGSAVGTLLEAPNPLAEYRLGETRIETIQTPGGDSLYMRLILPPGFREGTPHKTIVYVYGGPHSQQVSNTWLAGGGSWILWLNYLASEGYVIMTVDNHGTPYRGRDFEQTTFRRLGTVEVQDQVLAVNHLIERGITDSSRVGVVGWSYGGFMAASLMTRAPRTFKVGISGAPVIDWKYYETVYTERYMDTPEANPEGFRQASVLTHVDSLNGRLLMIHGTSDDIVVWQNTLSFVQKAVEQGKPLDYFVYPGQKHGVRGKARLHLMRKMTAYFEENL